jgi:phage baseplate assembly protein W
MAANLTTNVYGTIQTDYILESPKVHKQDIYGFEFPAGANPNSYFRKKTGIELIKGAVKQLLLTERGERVMLPNYGCNLKKYLFQPLDETTFEEIKNDIVLSFNKYIVGAKLAKVAVFPTGDFGPMGGNSLQVVLSLKLDSDSLKIFDVEVNIQ